MYFDASSSERYRRNLLRMSTVSSSPSNERDTSKSKVPRFQCATSFDGVSEGESAAETKTPGSMTTRFSFDYPVWLSRDSASSLSALMA
jgi:hypothetical protein